jgi:hypothetical protein
MDLLLCWQPRKGHRLFYTEIQGSLSYYVNGVSQSWANRGDAYTTLSAGIFLTLVITGLDLSLYAAQISFFGYAGFQFSGQIALMAAFDKNLTQSEITQLHNALA